MDMQNKESSAMGTLVHNDFGIKYRFTLKKCNGRTKLRCPSCGQAYTLVPYVDILNKIDFPDEVGRCDREDHCGYHYTPKKFFADNPDAKKLLYDEKAECETKHIPQDVTPKPPRPPSYIDTGIMRRSMHAYEINTFVNFLHTLFDETTVATLTARYNIGTVRTIYGATVFWQVDMQGLVHAGKVMLYNPEDGHRVKDKTKRSTTWAHSILRIHDFNLEQCFFGEHLLTDCTKPVAIVESEKTAIIASASFPSFIWIASGGKSGCFNKRMRILTGRNVVLYPDLKATEEWQAKAQQMRRIGISVEVSTYLEDVASEEERDAGLDIADYIVKGIRERQFIESAPRREQEELLRLFVEKCPALQILIDKLQLELMY